MDRDREVAHATAHCPCLRLHGQQGHRQGTAAWEHADGQESAKPTKPKADDGVTQRRAHCVTLSDKPEWLPAYRNVKEKYPEFT